jgi:hypothetical protein
VGGRRRDNVIRALPSPILSTPNAPIHVIPPTHPTAETETEQEEEEEDRKEGLSQLRALLLACREHLATGLLPLLHPSLAPSNPSSPLASSGSGHARAAGAGGGGGGGGGTAGVGSGRRGRRAFSFSSALASAAVMSNSSPRGCGYGHGYGSLQQQAEQARASFLVLTHGECEIERGRGVC